MAVIWLGRYPDDEVERPLHGRYMAVIWLGRGTGDEVERGPELDAVAGRRHVAVPVRVRVCAFLCASEREGGGGEGERVS